LSIVADLGICSALTHLLTVVGDVFKALARSLWERFLANSWLRRLLANNSVVVMALSPFCSTILLLLKWVDKIYIKIFN
jgi:hypothetical protein